MKSRRCKLSLEKFIEYFSTLKTVLSESLALTFWCLGVFLFMVLWLNEHFYSHAKTFSLQHHTLQSQLCGVIKWLKLNWRDWLSFEHARGTHTSLSVSCVFFFVCFIPRHYIISTLDLHNGVTERFRSSKSPSLSHQQNTTVWSRLQQRIRAPLNDAVMEQNSIILLLGDVEMHRGVDLLSKVNIKAAEFSPLSTLSKFIWCLYWKMMSQILSGVFFLFFLFK